MTNSLQPSSKFDRSFLLQEALVVLEAERSRRHLTIKTRDQIEDEIASDRETCKTLHGFIQRAWHILEPTEPFLDNWHIGALCEHLEAVKLNQITRLQINQPPGTMKSWVTSASFPAWQWIDLPGKRYLTTSYKEGYAVRDSRKHRDIVNSDWWKARWPHIRLVRGGESNFENNFRGARLAVAMESLTAGRGNCEIIDDPHSTEQVESVAEIKRTTRIFRESATSRLNNPETDAIIVIMHRLHEEDVCGAIETLGLPYVKLVLPMEYTPSLTVKTPWFTDPRTEDGELLHPERLGPEKIKENKKELGDHAYATQYQQQARAREGHFYFNPAHFLVRNERDELHPVPYPKACDGVFTIIDSASKKGPNRDGTGAVHYAMTKYPKPGLVILDWELGQMEVPTLLEWMPNVFLTGRQLAQRCGARSGYVGCWIEDKDSGVVLLQHGQRKQWPVKPFPSEFTSLGKDGRAFSISGYVYKDLVRISDVAYAKQAEFHGKTRNHFWHQATTYRIGQGTAEDEDEMFDCLCYGVAAAFGNKKGV